MSTRKPPKIEAKIPFLSRFINFKAREEADLKKLYARTAFTPILNEEAIKNAIRKAITSPSTALNLALSECFIDLFYDEDVFNDPPPWSDVLDLKEQATLRVQLTKRVRFAEDTEGYIEGILNALSELFAGMLDEVPLPPDDPLFEVPLSYFFPNLALTLDKISNALFHDDEPYFEKFRQRYSLNLERIGKLPSESKLPPGEMIEQYLAGTPFLHMFRKPIPLTIPNKYFFEGAHIVGAPGSGKTQLLSSLFLHHLKSGASIVVIDSHGDLVRSIKHLDRIKDRLILIDPKDTKWPPAINIFDVKSDRLSTYDDTAREQVLAGAIETLEYLFSGFKMETTGKQETFFRYCMHLLITLPDTMGRNATLYDFIALMDDPIPYLPAIAKLPHRSREFLERAFDKQNKTFKETREQVRYRLSGVLENASVERLFNATHTKLDFFHELNNGAIIVIDTSKDFLKSSTGNYGRIFISLIFNAVLERAAIPEADRHPTLLLIDEAWEYFDKNCEDLLMQIRKYKCGVTFAHQHLSQADAALRASLTSATSIKMMSRLSMADARSMAPELRTSPEFISEQPELSFATFIRGLTAQAIAAKVEYGKLDREPRMSDDTFDAFREYNRRRIAIYEPPKEPEPNVIIAGHLPGPEIEDVEWVEVDGEVLPPNQKLLPRKDDDDMSPGTW